MKQMLTPDELRAVKFYEGDIPECDSSDPFWGDTHAYVTLNALLYDDLATEYTRVREGKQLNPEMLRDRNRLRALYAALHSAAEKGAGTRSMTGYRVERARDFQVCLQKGMTCAFTSTSIDGFLPAYGDKQEIVLLTYHVPAGVPRIVFSEMLDSYRKSSENEMLLPPFLRFSVRERPLSDADCTITDLNDEPPKAAYLLEIHGTQKSAPALADDTWNDVYPAVCRLYAQMQAQMPEAALDSADCAAYLQCKRAIQRFVKSL